MDKSKNITMRIVSVAAVLTLTLLFAFDAFAYPTVTTITMSAVNNAPVAENIYFTTYRNVAVTESFKAIDPDGDDVSFVVTSSPKKGEVDIDGDKFTYTPKENKKGNDCFCYTAVDSLGNVSEEATVKIKILKQKTKVSYSDMEGEETWYAATALAEKGIFVGEKIGDSYYFSPAASVTRGEFLAMCMELNGTEIAERVTKTGFFDDDEIPMWQKPYVAAALMSDYISGYTDENEHTLFMADEPITAAEASVMLDNILSITDCASVADDACPAWACQAVSNLNSCGVDTPAGYSEALTRGDAASLLAGAFDLANK